MSVQLIISIAVVTAVLGAVAVKVVLLRVLNFKVDESAILKHVREFGGEDGYCAVEDISMGTQLDVSRVREVCGKSKFVKKETGGSDAWCLC